MFFWWQFEPEHVFPPGSFGLDVQQMFGSYVLADRVIAPGATSKGEGRLQAEVVDVPDGSLAGRHIHQHTTGLYGPAVGINLLCLILINIEDTGVAVTAQGNQGCCHVGSLPIVVTLVHCQHRTELLMGKRL